MSLPMTKLDDDPARWRKVAETILLAPYMGSAAPYLYHSACMELGHPLIPRGDDCRCGDVKKGRAK